jgi:hypothetical protein
MYALEADCLGFFRWLELFFVMLAEEKGYHSEISSSYGSKYESDDLLVYIAM